MSNHRRNRQRSERQFHFSRRNFLRGIGACVALPAFESLLPRHALAAAAAAGNVAVTATGAPLRTAFLYFPNGAIPRAWWPEGEGAEFKFSRTLDPLAEHREMLQILGGVDQVNAEPGPDGAGDHARANGTFLTSVRCKKSATDIRAGVSIDQVIAGQVGHTTRMPSIELSCEQGRQTGSCDSGYACAYQFNLAWRSATTPVTPEANPRLAFERLFGAGDPGERAANLELRRKQQRSVLDFVREDARAMQTRLGARDVAKLDQYLTGVREIESRIQQAEKMGGPKDPNVPAPAGVPDNFTEHVALMYDIVALAFQTDLTRVATLLLSHDGSNRSFDEIGVSEGHHDLSHQQNREDWIAKIEEIDLWYSRQFAKFLDKLSSIEDVDGKSLLYNSMLVYGSGCADANRHSHTNLPVILAGAGGGALNPGRYVKHKGKPLANLFLTMADRMGVQGLDRFGDSTDRLSDV